MPDRGDVQLRSDAERLSPVSAAVVGRAVRGSHAQARKLGQYSPVRDLARQVPPTNRLPGGSSPQASRGENLFVPAIPAVPCPMSERMVPATISGISLIHPNSFL